MSFPLLISARGPGTGSVPPRTLPPRFPRPRSILLLVVGAAGFFAAIWMPMGSGRLWHHDEILTAERARGMLVTGDPWAVRLNGKPNFQKPPLQYWVTAGLLRIFPDQPERAVRLPNALAATLCLLATAALGRLAWPDDPLAGPAAGLALAGCGFWVHFARMGMLDAGAALGVVGTLFGAEVARRRGNVRGWWLAAAAATLGAWQKAPYALGAWAVTLIGCTRNGELPREPARWPGTLRLALPLAGVLVMVWPVWQGVRFGAASVMTGSSDSTANLFNANKSSGFQPWLYLWWLARDWGLFGLLAPVAGGVALCRRNPRDPFRWELGLLLTLGWGVVAGLPYRTERYLVFLLPVAALTVVRWLRRDAAGRTRRHGGVLLTAALASTIPVALFHYRKPYPDRANLYDAARAFGAACAADTQAQPVIDRDLPSGINVPTFVQFYGDLRRPAFIFEGWTQPAFVRADARRPGERFVGLSRPGVAGALGQPREISRHGDWSVWEISR